MYKNIKIKRYTLYKKAAEAYNAPEEFDVIDNYKTNIEKYIYTDIYITDGTEGIEKAFQSRLQKLVSSILLRSLLLKDGIILVLNNNNFPSYHAVLKAFLEVAAVLGYITYYLYQDVDYEPLMEKMKRLDLGNREAGSLFVGTVNAINILTMFEKSDQQLKNMSIAGVSDSAEIKKIKQGENVLESFYKDVCNFGHGNFNAHLSIGILDKDNTWRAKGDSHGYKRELYAFYMPPFMTAIEIIELFLGLITEHKKVQNFNLLNNTFYFSESWLNKAFRKIKFLQD